jgi:hypothetical protein
MMSDDRSWEAGSWEGSRRAQLRRSLRLSVRERLEVMESLTETAAGLARAGASNREGRESQPGSAGR